MRGESRGRLRREITMSGSATGPVKRLLRFARPYRMSYLVAIIFFLIKDSPAWILPLVTAAIIDVVVGGSSPTELLLPAAIALGVLAQNFPTNMAYVHFSSRATRSLALDLREQIVDHLQRLRLSFHQRSGSAVIHTKLVRDVENVELMIQQTLPIALSGVFSLVGAIVMTALSVPIFLVIFGLVVPVGMALVIFFRRRSRLHNEAFRTQVEKFSTEVGDMSAMLPLARAHAIEQASLQRVSEQAGELKNRGVELDWLNGKFGALTWLSYQILGVVALVGAATLSLTGIVPVTPGQVVLVASYFAVIMGNAIGLLNILPVLARGLESLRSIGDIIEDEDVEANEGKRVLTDFDGRVQARNLTVALSGRDVLRGVDIDIAPGEFVALVGASGSGKTTLAWALLGLVRVRSGIVRLSGQNADEVDMRSVRGEVSLVTQEPVVMNAAVRDNVAFGRDVDDAAILKALRSSDLTDLATAEGLDTLLGTNGVVLSVGQRQRLAFARALYRSPKLLVLDEATSALDPTSQKALMRTLQRVRGKVSLLVIAHRLQTIKKADRIYVLDDGVVVEVGDHASLMAQGGHYSDLVRDGES